MASINQAYSPAQQSPRLVIGSDTLSHDAVAEKMRQDIAFLTSRVNQLQAQVTPNPNVLKVYQDMLDSRHAILTWLEQTERKAASN